MMYAWTVVVVDEFVLFQCSSTASLDILFKHHIYISTFVAMGVGKTCLFIPHTIDALWSDAKNNYI